MAAAVRLSSMLILDIDLAELSENEMEVRISVPPLPLCPPPPSIVALTPCILPWIFYGRDSPRKCDLGGRN